MRQGGTYSASLMYNSTSVPESVRIGHLMAPLAEIGRLVAIPLKFISLMG